MKRDKLAKDLKKGARRLTKDVKKSVNELPGTTTGKIVAGAAGLAAAGAIGVAAVTMKGKKKVRAYRVVPSPGAEGGWEVQLEGRKKPVEVFPRKRSAVAAARKTASHAAPSTLAIHTKGGRIQRIHTYEGA